MLFNRIQEAGSKILEQVKHIPETGLILGTGLKGLTEEMEVEVEIPYTSIPNFPIPSVVTHGASLLIGKMNNHRVAVLTGRFHFYEGFSMEEVTFGVGVLAFLGVKRLIMTNITGSVNPDFKIGDIVAIKDHINLQSANPLRPSGRQSKTSQENVQPHDERLGPRFPSLLNAYDPDLRLQARSVAQSLNIQLHEGVYTAMDGPSLETPAEYRMIHLLGGDVVGMSTVPEVIVAKQRRIKTLVLSLVSNKCYPIDDLKEDTIEAILEQVDRGVPDLKKLLFALLRSFS